VPASGGGERKSLNGIHAKEAEKGAGEFIDAELFEKNPSWPGAPHPHLPPDLSLPEGRFDTDGWHAQSAEVRVLLQK